jgi:hypothetical protein
MIHFTIVLSFIAIPEFFLGAESVFRDGEKPDNLLTNLCLSRFIILLLVALA